MSDDFTVEKIGKLKKVSSSVDAFKRFVETQSTQGIPNDRQYFESLMRQEKRINATERRDAEKAIVDGTKKPSLMDELARINRKTEKVTEASTHNLIAQTQEAVGRIDLLKQSLDKPGLEIKGSVQGILKGKLRDINESLKLAFSKAGIDYVPPEKIGPRANPAREFLNYLSHGQHQLETLSTHVEGIAARRDDEIRPADLLALQIKMNHVQQELEFFSGMLNKTLESTKTLMNVQV